MQNIYAGIGSFDEPLALNDSGGTRPSFYAGIGEEKPTSLGFLRSIDSVEGEFGTSLDLSPRQRFAELSARTETLNLQREFSDAGVLGEFESFAEREGRLGVLGTTDFVLETAINPIFDLLSVGNFATAGFTQELLRTGSAWEGFKQAALEMGNALPGLDFTEEGARRPSFVDVFKENGTSKWQAAAFGFILDVLLDPINFVPGGLLLKGAKLGGAKVLSKSGRLGEGATRAFDFLFTADSELKALDRIGGETGKATLEWRNLSDTEAENLIVAAKDNLDEMLGWLQPFERRLFGTAMDQPALIHQAINRLANTGALDPERIPGMQAHLKIIKRYTEDLFKEMKDYGLIDQSMHRAHYVHGTEALDKALGKAHKKLIKERAVRTDKNILPGARAMSAAQPRETKNQLDRIMKMLTGEIDVPSTELDIGNILVKRTVDQIRWVQNRKLIAGVLTDGRIVKKVNLTDKSLLNNPAKWKKARAEFLADNPGYDFLEVTQKTRLPGTKDISEDVLIGAHLMPKQVVDAITKADMMLKSEDELAPFFNWFNDWTGVWKGWATFGPGFHMRNSLGVGFMDWLAGVGTDYKGWLKGETPAPGQFALRHLQGLQLQVIAEGAGRMPLKAKKAADKIAQGLGFKDFESIPFPEVIMEGKKASKRDIIQRGEALGVPQTATRLYDAPEHAPKELWGGLEPEHVNLEAIAEANIPSELKAALTMGIEDRPGVGTKLVDMFGRDSPALQAHRAFAMMPDNNGRWTLFLDRLIKGAPSDQAAVTSKTWHFDYRNLTEFEKRVLRPLIPFYAWMRFSTPRILSAMLEDPARFSKVPKFKEAIESLSDEWKDLPTPDYFEETQALQLPAVMNDKPLFAEIDLPVLKVNRFNKKDLMSGLHPFIKTLFESMPSGGYSFFLGAPIEQFPGQPSEGLQFLSEEVEESTGVKLPVLSRLQENRLTSAFPPFGRFVGRPLRAASRDELLAHGISELTGIRLRALDTRRVLRAQTFQKRKLARDFKRKLQAEGRLR